MRFEAMIEKRNGWKMENAVEFAWVTFAVKVARAVAIVSPLLEVGLLDSKKLSRDSAVSKYVQTVLRHYVANLSEVSVSSCDLLDPKHLEAPQQCCCDEARMPTQDSNIARPFDPLPGDEILPSLLLLLFEVMLETNTTDQTYLL